MCESLGCLFPLILKGLSEQEILYDCIDFSCSAMSLSLIISSFSLVLDFPLKFSYCFPPSMLFFSDFLISNEQRSFGKIEKLITTFNSDIRACSSTSQSTEKKISVSDLTE